MVEPIFLEASDERKALLALVLHVERRHFVVAAAVAEVVPARRKDVAVEFEAVRYLDRSQTPPEAVSSRERGHVVDWREFAFGVLRPRGRDSAPQGQGDAVRLEEREDTAGIHWEGRTEMKKHSILLQDFVAGDCSWIGER